jgi:serine/threonine-protein kinase RsbW
MEDSPDNVFEASFPASTSGLGIALKDIETFCSARTLPRKLVSCALVVVEELFTNTIKYGYGGECERPVRLKLIANKALQLVFEDDAPPFDPTKDAPLRHELPDEGPEGRHGLAIVFGLTASAAYARLPDGNRLTLIVEA